MRGGMDIMCYMLGWVSRAGGFEINLDGVF